jgi:hypothetical protein
VVDPGIAHDGSPAHDVLSFLQMSDNRSFFLSQQHVLGKSWMVGPDAVLGRDEALDPCLDGCVDDSLMVDGGLRWEEHNDNLLSL